MPVTDYGVLKGRALDLELNRKDDHFQILVGAKQDRDVDREADTFRIAVNVKSNVKKGHAGRQREDFTYLCYYVDTDFEADKAWLAKLEGLDFGFHLIEDAGLEGLDYVRGGKFDIKDMKVAPTTAPFEDDDLNDLLNKYVVRAIQDNDAIIYVFGSRWHDNKADSHFGRARDTGVHDIHMNQGNDRGHRKDDGVGQDGGLLFYFPAGQTPVHAAGEQWVAVYLAFQSQSVPTDGDGHAQDDSKTLAKLVGVERKLEALGRRAAAEKR